MNQAESSLIQDPPAIDIDHGELKHLPRVTVINGTIIAAAVVLAIIAFITSASLVDAMARSGAAHQRYEECSEATTKLLIASDYLTTQSRMFVVTGDEQYMYNYLEELFVSQNRDKAVEVLNREIDDARAAAELTEALSESNELAIREMYAMKLVAQAESISPLPDALESIVLSPEDEQLDPDEAKQRAESILLDNQYRDMKSSVVSNVNDCTTALIEGIQQKELSVEKQVDGLTFWLLVIISLLVALIAFAASINYALIIRPMQKHARNLRDNEPLAPAGSYELQRVVTAYNKLYEANWRTTMYLKREAETDALTELLNRGAYDKMLERCVGEFVLIIIDIDHFKQVNDQYGHQVGDTVLKRTAAAITYHFRDTDYVCRIGGDEFAVIMTGVGPDNRDTVAQKAESIAKMLAKKEDGLPETTLSIGIAFNTELKEGDSIYHAADKALYEAKRNGRNQYAFYADL